MRHRLRALAFGLCCCAPLGSGWAVPPNAAQVPASGKGAAALPTSAVTSDSFAAAAAARHARRTECLKEAKSRRLVGESRNSYVRDCLEAR